MEARARQQRGKEAPGEGLPPELETPYLDALAAYAARDPGRFHVPGHGGGPGADPALARTFGEGALRHDIPALVGGIDAGDPSPMERARRLAARAWGAGRTWFLVNGGSQGNHAACLTLAQLGRRVIVQRNVHSSTIDGIILAGLEPTFVSPEIDPERGIIYCLEPEALDRALDETPGAVGALVGSPTYEGCCADLRGLVEVAHSHRVPLVVDEAWGTHLAFSDLLPEHALAAGADLVVSSPHKVLGSLTQSALLHLGRGAQERLPEDLVARSLLLTSSTSPSSLLIGSLDATRRLAATEGRHRLEITLDALAETREAIRAITGLDVLDERLVGDHGVAGYDPLRLVIDVRGTGLSGYELARAASEGDDVHLEYASPPLLVAVLGIGGHVAEKGKRLVAALERAVGKVDASPRAHLRPAISPPPFGPLVLDPRRAFLGPQDVIPFAEAAGRIAAETLASYPPGVASALPGERLAAEHLHYLTELDRQGGTIRGAADQTLRTLRVVAE
jgi:arginine decarboxylase